MGVGSTSAGAPPLPSEPDPGPPEEEPEPAAESRDSSRSSPSSPPSQSPLTEDVAVSAPTPDFMRALSLQHRGTDPVAGGGAGGGASHGGGAQEGSRTEQNQAKVVPSHVTLAEKFKQDPSSVMELLQAALSMDKLASLIKSEYRSDTEALEELQNKLEEAYKTLQGCSEQKDSMKKQISETEDKVKTKRKHLEDLREELKELGEEEAQLKKRRDASYATCSELKKKMKSSREALQQIAVLSSQSENGTTLGSSLDARKQGT